MASKGLFPFKPKLSTYPYNSDIVKKEGASTSAISPTSSNASSELSSPPIASHAHSTTMKESLQPLSSQAPVIGEKYYFSKTPISNDVAKAAAATVMAIASSAINASISTTTSKTATTSTLTSTKPIGKKLFVLFTW